MARQSPLWINICAPQLYNFYRKEALHALLTMSIPILQGSLSHLMAKLDVLRQSLDSTTKHGLERSLQYVLLSGHAVLICCNLLSTGVLPKTFYIANVCLMVLWQNHMCGLWNMWNQIVSVALRYAIFVAASAS